MRAVLVGAVESTRVALKCLAASPAWDLAAVLTLPVTLGHRHSDFVDLSGDAAALATRLVTVSNINVQSSLELIEDLAPDYIFVIGWSQLCGARVQASAPGGLIGFHPAPLPRLRGRAIIPWTILLDEPISASTLFRIDDGVDSGPILAQRFFHVASDETAESLYAKHMTMLAEILPPMLIDLAHGRAPGVPQDERYSSYGTRRRPEDARIDWTAPVDDIWRMVRACGAPYPGAWTILNDSKVVIAAAHPVSLTRYRASMPGQIVERTDSSFTVRCGDDGGLQVTQWSCPADGALPVHAILGRESMTR